MKSGIRATASLSTIVIHNVDTKMLERQRKRLHALLFRLANPAAKPTKHEINALEGVVSMLDDWSDNNIKTRSTCPKKKVRRIR